MRIILLFLVLGLIIAPFVIMSLVLDERGITIAGKVWSKREDVTIHQSSWTRTSTATFEYAVPETGGNSFFSVDLSPERYDELHVGERVMLHYLRRQDLPGSLRKVPLLFKARLADQRTFSSLQMLLTPQVLLACEAIAGVVLILIAWRLFRIPLFAWAIGLAAITGVSVLLFYDFPRPVRQPVSDVRQGTARVKTVNRIERLFQNTHSRGLEAHQPVQVVALEFTPANKSEPVVAVDLIDSESVPGLKEGSSVPVAYEEQHPRTAYIQLGSRNFFSRNFAGIVEDGIICLLVLIACWLGWQLLSRAFQKLTNRPSGNSI